MTETRPEPVSLAVGAIAAQVIGGLVTQLSPLIIGGLMRGLSLSERDAGFISSAELLVLAITAIAIAPFLSRFSLRRVSLVAVALTLLPQAASIFSTSIASLAALRCLAGVGEGMLYAISLCIVASRSSNPDKLYGYFQLVWALGSALLFAIGGQLTERFAHRGVFALVACVTLALAPLLVLIPGDRAESGHDAAADPARASPIAGVLTLAAIGVYLTASSAVYAFSAPLGERAGLGASAVGYALTAAMLVGFAGAGAAAFLNVRWGRMIPISASCAGFALCALALCLSRNPTIYVTALVASAVIFYFSVPYLFGLAAGLDRSGRWAAAAGSAYLLGFAAGPLVGGGLIAWADYTGLAIACVAVAVTVWGLTMLVHRRDARRRDHAGPTGPVIAVVDDDPRLLEALEDLLESAGYAARLFSSAGSLLLTGLSAVDVLICDIGMPGIDGFELGALAKKVRPDLPVFLITGRHEIGDEGRAQGANGFFRKPFDGQVLLEAVGEVLRNSNKGVRAGFAED